MHHHRGNVGAALAQRRDAQRYHVQAVIEIGSELPRLDRLREVSVGGGDDADVHLDRPVAADRLELFLLQHPQQLHLRRDREFANLVEEQRAAVRQFESSDTGVRSSGERPTHVAEQLTFHQIGRHRPAVHLHERPTAATAAAVDRPCDKFFSRARFAEHQHVRVGRGRGLDVVQQLQQFRAAADYFREIVLAAYLFEQVGVFAVELCLERRDLIVSRAAPFLGLLEVVNVRARPDEPHDLAVLVSQRHRPVDVPVVPAVRDVQERGFECPAPPGLDPAPKNVPDAFFVVGVQAR